MAKIVVIDDDPLLGEMVGYVLEGAGHKVSYFTDGVAGISCANRTHPDVIILDSMMPVLSGPEVLHALGLAEATKSIPVVMLTAKKEQRDVVAAFNCGASDYIKKPFPAAELVLRIERVVPRALAYSHAA